MSDLREFSLQEIKLIGLKMLCWFDVFCRENNINYFLWAGTLLGAIRHKGFIPWDDDIDIGMLRDDYDKFCKLMKGYNGRYHFYSIENNEKYTNEFGKLIDKKTYIKGQNCGVELGIWLDIFPFDNDVPDIKKRKRLKRKLTIMDYYNTFINNPNHKSRGIKRIIAKIFDCIFRPFGSRWVMNIYTWLIKRDNKFKLEYVSTKSRFYNPKNMFTKQMFANTVSWDFEGHRFLIPYAWDEVLKGLYGNYMEPPPPEKRTPPHKYWGYYKEDNV